MNSVQQYLVEEQLEHYRDGFISRREFMRRATMMGVAASTAVAMAQSVGTVKRASASQAAMSPVSVPANDPAVMTDWITYRSTDGAELKAYLAWPSSASMNMSNPGVAVCQENRGVNDHIQDVARRFAKQGYVAIAPDLVSRSGRATSDFTDPADYMAALSALDPNQNAMDFVAALDYLEAHPAVDQNKLAATGYCFGGGVTWRLTEQAANLKAAAPFYGTAPPLADVPNIRAAVLGVYAGLDERVNATITDLEPALQAAGVTYKVNIYPDSNHGFHNDTNAVYNPTTAMQAWMDTLNWFAQYLGLPAPTM